MICAIGVLMMWEQQVVIWEARTRQCWFLAPDKRLQWLTSHQKSHSSSHVDQPIHWLDSSATGSNFPRNQDGFKLTSASDLESRCNANKAWQIKTKNIKNNKEVPRLSHSLIPKLLLHQKGVLTVYLKALQLHTCNLFPNRRRLYTRDSKQMDFALAGFRCEAMMSPLAASVSLM